MKKFFHEFGEFIAQGDVMSMAVGIIIGGAFTNIVDSLVNDLINPLLGLFGGVNFDQLSLTLFDGAVTFNYGSFITAVINFLIMAFIVFLLVQGVNAIENAIRKPAPEAPITKVCPFCKTEIPVDATRCPNCTSELPVEEPAAEETSADAPAGEPAQS